MTEPQKAPAKEFVDDDNLDDRGECEECGSTLQAGTLGPICAVCDYTNHFEGW